MKSMALPLFYGFVVATLIAPMTSDAETYDFGGYSERMKGHGDRIPPRCQIDLPRSASAPFFVQWYCPDEDTVEQNVRSELWIYRKGAPNGELVKSFLGFPAAVQINESLLGVTAFRDGLPVSVRLTATDQAGNTTMSPLLSIVAKTDYLNQCTLKITQSSSESSSNTTGIPESTVTVSDVLVTTSKSSDNTYRIISNEAKLADPCEIDNVCSSENVVGFAAEVVIGDSSTTGKISVSPGDLSASSLTGTSTVKDGNLKSAELSGDVEYENRTTTISINCSQ